MKTAALLQATAPLPRPASCVTRTARWLSAAALLAATPLVHAEAGNPLNDRFSISLGGFLLDTDTEIRVDGEAAGTEIDAGRDLGLQDADRFRVDAYWRMTPRQKLRLMYFDTNAENTRALQRDIIFDDEEYEIDLEVTGRIETQVTALSYEFDFLQSDTYELGGTFGIHNLGFEVGLEAEANGQSAVSISFDPYDGSVTDFTASVVWQATKHFGFGAGWNQFRTKVEVDGDRFDGELKWTYGGARIFVTASF
jgi:hypothetical protein